MKESVTVHDPMNTENYVLGALIPFALESKQETIRVHDTYCSLQQLYRLRDWGRPDATVYYGTVSSFEFPGRSQLLSEPFREGWDFITGVVDMVSTLTVAEDDLEMVIHAEQSLLEWVNRQVNLPVDVLPGKLVYRFTNVVDLFGKLKGSYKQQEFNQLLTGRTAIPRCVVYRRDPTAVIPTKSRYSDVGYDVSVIRKHKTLNSTTALYDTGIALRIPSRYYVEIVPRSSLSKSGYILANSVGIIDRSYQGNLYIALTRVADDAIELENQFPFRCCQLVFRRQQFVDLVEKEDENEVASARGSGGFGSTGQ